MLAGSKGPALPLLVRRHALKTDCVLCKSIIEVF